MSKDIRDTSSLESRLLKLQNEHNRLDGEVSKLGGAQAISPNLQVYRLKKEKLRLKDEIVHLQSMLRPDIIA